MPDLEKVVALITNSFTLLGRKIDGLVKEVRGIKPEVTVEAPVVNVEAPIVNIPAPIVNVEVPDVVVPEITMPEMPEIVIPEITIPDIVVPKPEIVVNVAAPKIPPIKVPEPKVTVNIPKTEFPTFPSFPEIPQPIPFPKVQKVLIVDVANNPIVSFGSGGGSVARYFGPPKLRGPNTDGSVTVGTTSGEVVPVNTERHRVTLVNDSDAVIYLRYGGPAVVGEGVRLNAEGGSHIDEVYTGKINAISIAADKNLTVLEL